MAFVDTFICAHKEESWTRSIRDLRQLRQKKDLFDLADDPHGVELSERIHAWKGSVS
jgi:hypothetical protein